jgi:hypothetical protein
MMTLRLACCCESRRPPPTNSPVTGPDVRGHIAIRYHLSITRGWVNSFLG